MKICFLPIDNRPVCYSLAKNIVSQDSGIELFLPPREILGGLTKDADIRALFTWLKSIPKTDVIILSLDTIAYGGLIPSRRSKESFDEIKNRLEVLKQILKEKDATVLRASNNIPNVNVTYADVLGTYDIVANSKLYITKDAIKKLEEAYK